MKLLWDDRAKKTAKNRKIFSAKNAEIRKICADAAQMFPCHFRQIPYNN